MTEKSQFSIVWQKCGENSYIAKRFYVPNYVGYLPFFIYGEDLKLLENKQDVELREEHLLKGILLALHDVGKRDVFWYSENSKQTFLDLLEILGRGFGYTDPEKMILDAATDIRDKNGSEASAIALSVGHDLLPTSSRIMSDLITDIWMNLANSESGELPEDKLQKIVDLAYQIEMEDLHPQAQELIPYFSLTTLIILGEEEKVSEYYENYVEPYVNDEHLQNKIASIMENPQEAKIELFM